MAAPQVPTLDTKTEEALRQSNDWDAWSKAYKDSAARAGTAGLVDEGRVYHWDGASWRKLDLPTVSVIKDAYLETPEQVWLVGTGGMILRGNAASGFESVNTTGTTDTLLSFARFGGTYYVASDYALHTFDGHGLAPFPPPRLRRMPPSPFKLQAIDNILFYFDYKQGVHRFNGTEWERISIPPELLERAFKGLHRTP